MSGVTAPLFHRRCRPSTGVDRKFSAVTFSHKALTEQAYILLAARLLYLGSHHLARAEPDTWQRYLNNLAWLCGSDFRSSALVNATKQLDFRLAAWNSRLHLNLPLALYFFVIPIAVASPAGKQMYSAIGAVGLSPEKQRESYGFIIQKSAEPDWADALPSILGSCLLPPGIAVYHGNLSILRDVMNRIWPETFLTSPDADDFPQSLPPSPEQPILDAFQKALRDLEISSFPDLDSAYELIGGIMADQEMIWDRQRSW